jgi:hypothetical protein
MRRGVISESVHDLLIYLVMYKRLRRPTMSKRKLLDELIVQEAKRLVTGMPEELWRQNLIQLINAAEEKQ